jgi:hypothetical protein
MSGIPYFFADLKNVVKPGESKNDMTKPRFALCKATSYQKVRVDSVGLSGLCH